MSKQKCKLCACDGVDNTLLCREHLDGYEYAYRFLAAATVAQLSKLIAQQPKEADDNGKSK
jgi:hypothetical protein